MTDREMIIKLLEGHSLRTRMVPDSAMPTSFPEHVETYNLPHVIIKGDLFWAKSVTAHLRTDKVTSQPIANICFCYTNSTNWFISTAPDYNNSTFAMKKRRYREHNWVLKKKYRLVWDSEGGQPAEAVRDEIDAAAKFKVAMLDSENVWNIHPVDLPMYYPGKGAFELKTIADWYITHFREPLEFARYLETTDFGIDAPDDLKHAVGFSCAVGLDPHQFSTFYHLHSDGTYQNYYDLSRGTRQEYKALRVYSDNL